MPDFIRPTPEYSVLNEYYHDFTSNFQILIGANSTGKSRLTMHKCYRLPQAICELRKTTEFLDSDKQPITCRLGRVMIIRESKQSIMDNLIPMIRETFPPDIRYDEREGFTKPKILYRMRHPETGEDEWCALQFTLIGLNDTDAHNRHRGGNYDAIILNEVEKLGNREEGVSFMFSRISRNVLESKSPIIFGDTNPVPASHWIWNWIPMPEDAEIDKSGHEFGFIKEKVIKIPGFDDNIRRCYHAGNQLANAQAGRPLANPVTPAIFYVNLAEGYNENDRRKNLEGKIPMSEHQHLVFPSFGRAHCGRATDSYQAQRSMPVRTQTDRARLSSHSSRDGNSSSPKEG